MTKGTYFGGTWGSPWGVGGGLYMDNHGRIYPQAYGGTPGFSLSAGYTPDLEGLLTGTSISGSFGRGPVRLNAGTSGNALGVGIETSRIGTPGVGVTYGAGPLEMSRDFSRPWATPYIRDSAAAAGVPGRYNTWEYDYPDLPSIPATPSPSVFDTGTAPVAFLPASKQNSPGGLPGMMAEAGLIDPSNPDQPPPGGLPGLIQEWMRNNPNCSTNR